MRSLRVLLVEALAVSALMFILVVEFERRGGRWVWQDVQAYWQLFLKALGG